MRFSHVDHLSLIVRNLAESEQYYRVFLGEPVRSTESLKVFQIDRTLVYLKEPVQPNEKYVFDKDQVGINHFAFGVASLDELHDMIKLLDQAGIQHSNVQLGKFGNEYIWFDDPNGIRLEIFHRPPTEDRSR